VVLQLLKKLNKGPKNIITDKKGCEWKVMIAHLMKRNLGVSNHWLVDNLKMGTRNNVSRNVTLFERKCGFKQKAYKQVMLTINTRALLVPPPGGKTIFFEIFPRQARLHKCLASRHLREREREREKCENQLFSP
jgi:hypothetical protein